MSKHGEAGHVGYIVVRTKNHLYGRKCKLCAKELRSGDVAIAIDRGLNQFVDRYFLYHRRCMERLFVEFPQEMTDVTDAIDKIRDHIARTGKSSVEAHLDG